MECCVNGQYYFKYDNVAKKVICNFYSVLLDSFDYVYVSYEKFKDDCYLWFLNFTIEGFGAFA